MQVRTLPKVTEADTVSSAHAVYSDVHDFDPAHLFEIASERGCICETGALKGR
jgi:hypothetical protein